MIDVLIKKNPNIKVLPVSDLSFSKFGRILDSKYFSSAFEYLNNQTIVPKERNNYVAHDQEFKEYIKSTVPFLNTFGSIDIQYGYVNGNNSFMNALEYHKSSEINIAATDMVLLLGSKSDLKDNQFDSNHLVAYYIPKDTVIEVYPEVLHFSPCKVSDEGFKCGVILPKGTNVEFCIPKVITHELDKLLFKTNKWLIAHKSFGRFIDLGAVVGINGENIEIKY